MARRKFRRALLFSDAQQSPLGRCAGRFAPRYGTNGPRTGGW